MAISSHPHLAERQAQMFYDVGMVILSCSCTVDYNTAIENVSKTFIVENAHNRMLNGAELNLGDGARALIRAGWGVGPGAADVRGVAWKPEKRGSLACSALI